MTSWNMPPGCNVRDIPGYEDQPCAICGKFPDNCICPECSICGSFGDPICYDTHGLVRSQAQIDSLTAAEAEWEADAESFANLLSAAADSVDDMTDEEVRAELEELRAEDPIPTISEIIAKHLKESKS